MTTIANSIVSSIGTLFSFSGSCSSNDVLGACNCSWSCCSRDKLVDEKQYDISRYSLVVVMNEAVAAEGTDISTFSSKKHPTWIVEDKDVPQTCFSNGDANHSPTGISVYSLRAFFPTANVAQPFLLDSWGRFCFKVWVHSSIVVYLDVGEVSDEDNRVKKWDILFKSFRFIMNKFKDFEKKKKRYYRKYLLLLYIVAFLYMVCQCIYIFVYWYVVLLHASSHLN